MEMLNNEQIRNIERLNWSGIKTRTEMAKALCVVLGNEFSWSNGFVNGHGNSIVLLHNNNVVEIGTYKIPNGVSLRFLDDGSYSYVFNRTGEIKAIYKHIVKQVSDNSFEHGIEKVY